jgi:hypothetical protein
MFFVVFTVGVAFGFLVVANMIVKSQGQSYWGDEQEQERYRMRRMTFLLFQLFLAIFAGYSAIDLPNSYVFTWKAPTGPTRDYNRVEKTGFAFSNHPNPRYRTVHNKRSAVNYRTQAGNSANARITYFNPHFPS